MARKQSVTHSVDGAFFFLPIMCFVMGLCVFILGIQETIHNDTKGFVSTTGYYDGKTLAKEAGYDTAKQAYSDATYTLSYIYTVDGVEYNVQTDYSTSVIPEYNSTTEILYNPQNPEDARVGGPNKSNYTLLYIGGFFLFVSLMFLIPMGRQWILEIQIQRNYEKTKGKLEAKEEKKEKRKIQVDWMMFSFGLGLAVVSYIAMAMMCGTFSVPGIVHFLNTRFSIPLMIGLLLFIVSCISVVYAIFGKKKDDFENRHLR